MNLPRGYQMKDDLTLPIFNYRHRPTSLRSLRIRLRRIFNYKFTEKKPGLVQRAVMDFKIISSTFRPVECEVLHASQSKKKMISTFLPCSFLLLHRSHLDGFSRSPNQDFLFSSAVLRSKVTGSLMSFWRKRKNIHERKVVIKMWKSPCFLIKYGWNGVCVSAVAETRRSFSHFSSETHDKKVN